MGRPRHHGEETPSGKAQRVCVCNGATDVPPASALSACGLGSPNTPRSRLRNQDVGAHCLPPGWHRRLLGFPPPRFSRAPVDLGGRAPAPTFFVGIFSFRNSASLHSTFQGAWIFTNPTP